MSRSAVFAAFTAKYGSSSPLAAMIEASRRVLDAIGYTEGQPDFRAILGYFNAVVEERRTALEGGLTIRQATYVVVIRKDRPATRKRFTIAHELGHILLMEGAAAVGPTRLAALARNHSDVEVEALCDRAASELLMPPDDSRKQLLAQPFSSESILRLADRYGVSIGAAIRRVPEVLDETNVVLLSRDRGTSGSSQRYEVLKPVMGAGLYLQSPLPARALKPNALADADVRGRLAVNRLTIAVPKKVSLTRRAIVLPLTPTVHVSEPFPIFHASTSGASSDVADLRSRLAGVQSGGDSSRESLPDYILLLQKVTGPSDEWKRLKGPVRRNSSRTRKS